jgi:hypothetical protein
MLLLRNRLGQLLEEVAEFEIHFARNERGELQLVNKRAELPLFPNDKILNPTQLLSSHLS